MVNYLGRGIMRHLPRKGNLIRHYNILFTHNPYNILTFLLLSNMILKGLNVMGTSKCEVVGSQIERQQDADTHSYCKQNFTMLIIVVYIWLNKYNMRSSWTLYGTSKLEKRKHSKCNVIACILCFQLNLRCIQIFTGRYVIRLIVFQIIILKSLRYIEVLISYYVNQKTFHFILRYVCIDYNNL